MPSSAHRGAVHTEFYPVTAVHVEGLVALVDLPVQGIEHKTVRTQLLRSNPIVTLVVLIALLRVLELTVFLRAVKCSTWQQNVGL